MQKGCVVKGGGDGMDKEVGLGFILRANESPLKGFKQESNQM